MILLIACCMSRLISERILRARINDASILDRMGEDAIEARRRLLIRALINRIYPGEVVILTRRRALLRSFLCLLLALRMDV